MSAAMIYGTIIAIGFAVLQSNVLHGIAITGVVPDVALIVVVFLANKKGSLVGELTGFGAGVAQDLLSLAPIGFHAFSKTLIGYLVGKTHGKTFLDPIFLPILMVFIATLMQGLMASTLVAVFRIEPAFSGVLSTRFAVELAYNALLAPPIFALLRFVPPLVEAERGGFA